MTQPILLYSTLLMYIGNYCLSQYEISTTCTVRTPLNEDKIMYVTQISGTVPSFMALHNAAVYYFKLRASNCIYGSFHNVLQCV